MAMSSPSRGKRPRMNTFLDVVGRTLIIAGLLLLAFVGYQLWGTGLAESRAQDKLAAEFSTHLASTTTLPSTPTTAPQPTMPKVGDIVGRLSIPSINVSKWIIAGVGYKQLEQGPGLFRGSPLPGQLGNVAIAGHRTTYGAPFGRINEIHDGAAITITTTTATYEYVVHGEPRIVSAQDVAVVKTSDPTIASLTLVSCHPKWTSKQRIIVTATLATPTAALPTSTFEPQVVAPEVLNEGWFHDLSAMPAAGALAAFMAGIWVGALLIVRRGRSQWAVYPITLMIFAPILFIFFGYLTRLLPTNL
jgi:sortase A